MPIADETAGARTMFRMPRAAATPPAGAGTCCIGKTLMRKSAFVPYFGSFEKP